MRPEKIEELAEVASMYYGDFLRNKTAPKHDYGDSKIDLMMELITFAATSHITSVQVSMFEEKLKELILEEFKHNQHRISIYVDYHPDMILVSAAEAAGIKLRMGIFPGKSGIVIEKGHVFLKQGYGKNYEVLY